MSESRPPDEALEPNERFHLRVERPISSLEEDRLGFGSVALALRDTIAAQPLGDGFVVGIEGGWGSGKSSILSIALSALKTTATDRPDIRGRGVPIVIDFRPWTIGNRDALIEALIAELIFAIDRTYSKDRSVVGEAARLWRHCVRALRRYGTALSIATRAGAAVLDAATRLPIFSVSFSAAIGSRQRKPLSDLKADVERLLRELGRRIIVTIDDLDRLEPSELAEVLRLVRSVADFPNIIYVTCYDPKLVTASIEKALKIDDGLAFLAKIVQATLRVPVPDGFDLRHWLQNEINAMIPPQERAPWLTSANRTAGLPEGEEPRLERTIMDEGERRLSTPRDVVRLLNLLKLHSSLIGQVDLPDLVWLLMIKMRAPTLYLWITAYAEEVTQQELGANLSDLVRTELDNRFSVIMAGEGWTPIQARRILGERFPTIAMAKTGNSLDLFVKAPDSQRAAYDSQRRLGSPNYSRRFFAFQSARGSLTPDLLTDFIESLNDRQKAAARMLTLSAERRPQGGDMAQLVIETLATRIELVPSGAFDNLCLAFSDILDEAVRGQHEAEFGFYPLWSASTRLLEAVFGTTAANQVFIVAGMFGEGKAYAFLAQFLRSALKERQRGNSTALSEAAFERARSLFVGRLMSRAIVAVDTARPLIVLWAWRDLSDPDEPRKYCEETAQSDEGLVHLLEGMKGWMAANGQVFHPLDRPSIDPFLDFDKAMSRVQLIAASGGLLAERARALSVAFAIGEQHFRPDSESFASQG